jgi:hypothetical protein
MVIRDLDSPENYARLWDDVWMTEERDNGETTPEQAVAE